MDKARKKELDEKIHALVGPPTLKKVKQMLADDKKRAKLANALKGLKEGAGRSRMPKQDGHG
ncbi:MAG: hypothetical protein PHP28_11390 [Actinomycetota bacterium]|nr:hypothetical protein [Actinomycetota bacterium]MDD5666363.1 hypothetical protein [Actinomycetota bacterium]